MTRDRRAALADARKAASLLEQAKEKSGQLVDGTAKIEKHLLKTTGIAPSQIGAQVKVKMPELAATSPALAVGRTSR